MTKNSIKILMTTIYFTDHQKQQLIKFLKIIYVTNCLESKFQKFTLEQNQQCQCLDTEIQ